MTAPGAAAPSWRPRLDVVFALATFSLAVLALRSPTLGWGGVLLAVLYTLAAAAFLRRGPRLADGTLADKAAALPGIAIGAIALSVAGPFWTWPWGAWALFGAGGVVAGWSLRTLRDAFAVLPARRALITRGPYAWVRHPMYAGELTMVAGAAVAVGGVAGVALVAVAAAATGLRLRVEERVLAADPEWAAYAARVRWWWVPGFV